MSRNRDLTGSLRDESCHASSTSLGLGISATRPWNETHFVDLETVSGEILSNRAQAQIEPIKTPDHDWSRIVDEDGQQPATVDHHFKLARAFNKTEIDRISREGTCLACHKEIPEKLLAVSFLHHVAEFPKLQSNMIHLSTKLC